MDSERLWDINLGNPLDERVASDVDALRAERRTSLNNPHILRHYHSAGSLTDDWISSHRRSRLLYEHSVVGSRSLGALATAKTQGTANTRLRSLGKAAGGFLKKALAKLNPRKSRNPVGMSSGSVETPNKVVAAGDVPETLLPHTPAQKVRIESSNIVQMARNRAAAKTARALQEWADNPTDMIRSAISPAARDNVEVHGLDAPETQDTLESRKKSFASELGETSRTRKGVSDDDVVVSKLPAASLSSPRGSVGDSPHITQVQQVQSTGSLERTPHPRSIGPSFRSRINDRRPLSGLSAISGSEIDEDFIAQIFSECDPVIEMPRPLNIRPFKIRSPGTETVSTAIPTTFGQSISSRALLPAVRGQRHLMPGTVIGSLSAVDQRRGSEMSSGVEVKCPATEQDKPRALRPRGRELTRVPTSEERDKTTQERAYHREQANESALTYERRGSSRERSEVKNVIVAPLAPFLPTTISESLHNTSDLTQHQQADMDVIEEVSETSSASAEAVREYAFGLIEKIGGLKELERIAQTKSIRRSSSVSSSRLPLPTFYRTTPPKSVNALETQDKLPPIPPKSPLRAVKKAKSDFQPRYYSQESSVAYAKATDDVNGLERTTDINAVNENALAIPKHQLLHLDGQLSPEISRHSSHRGARNSIEGYPAKTRSSKLVRVSSAPTMYEESPMSDDGTSASSVRRWINGVENPLIAAPLLTSTAAARDREMNARIDAQLDRLRSLYPYLVPENPSSVPEISSSAPDPILPAAPTAPAARAKRNSYSAFPQIEPTPTSPLQLRASIDLDAVRKRRDELNAAMVAEASPKKQKKGGILARVPSVRNFFAKTRKIFEQKEVK
ncbi:hypothetical protein MMC19_006436 [Ptychographa xylographoides]|nr:hypothetical protein [Ptychographa xylographoides]